MEAPAVYGGPITIDGASSGSATLNTRYDSTGCPGPTNLTSYAFQRPHRSSRRPAPPSEAGSASAPVTRPSAPPSTTRSGTQTERRTVIRNHQPVHRSHFCHSTRQFLFQAFKTNYINSAQAAETYSSAIPTPWFATPSQTLTNQTAITAASALNSYQSFVLTYPDGSVVTNSVSGSTATFNINEPGICSLQVFDPPWLPSAAATNSYTFQVADLAVNPPGGSFANRSPSQLRREATPCR